MSHTAKGMRRRRGKDHVTLNACVGCKKRKAKCDGLYPCSRCSHVDLDTCIYVRPTRVGKEVLRKRIEELEASAKHSENILKSLSLPDNQSIMITKLSEGETLETIYHRLYQDGSFRTEASTRETASTDLSNSSTSAVTSHGQGSRSSENSDSSCPTAVNSPDPSWPSKSPWTNVTSNTELVNHLHALYFCWEYPIFSIPPRTRFLRDRDLGRGRYCSPLLYNIIAALGCRFSDRPEVKKEFHHGLKFFAEAKRLWETEQARFSLSNTQATALMSLWEASQGDKARGSFYARQAIRIAVEIGLHDPRSFKKDSDDDVEDSHATFWATFVLDQIWSLSIGALPYFSGTGHEMSPPMILDGEDLIEWKPYLEDCMIANSVSVQPNLSTATFRSICELSKLICRSLHSIYSPLSSLTSEDIVEMYSDYLIWYDGMSDVLKSGNNSTPTALFIHIYYHFALLLLLGQFTDVQLAGSSIIPNQVCKESASAISALMASYRELYSLRRVHSFTPYMSLASSIMHSSVTDVYELDADGPCAKLLWGISCLDEMALSHPFSAQGSDLLQLLANRSFVEDACISTEGLAKAI